MKIERIEVDGGFLGGLNLPFVDGLNVLIGARGAGKTSVLELVRFALDVPAMTPEAQDEAFKQAKAVLGDGTVSVFCSVQGEQVVFTRTGLDEAPAASASFNYVPPLIVSQNEIEVVGLSPAGRRDILDRLIDPVERTWADGNGTRATIASLERRLERLRDERERFADQAAGLEGLTTRLAETEAEQATMAEAVQKAEPLQKKIAKQADELGQVRSSADAYRLTEEALAEWRERLSQSKLETPIPPLPSAAVEAQVQGALSSVREHLELAASDIAKAEKLVSDERVASRSRQTQIQKRLKADADRLEKLKTGAGEVGRLVSTLRQQLKERDGYLERVATLDAEIGKVIAERDAALDAQESGAQERYSLRAARAAELTTEFNGRIEVRVDKSGELAAYEAALVTALQGSNLRYKALSRALAEKVSPRELVAAVEASDAEQIAERAEISLDRAVRLVGHLKEESIVELLLAPLDDTVDFALLDGKEYKPTRNLSMGQRCTVVLPLLLAEEREAILLDQPEDHLDNAFIVDTLVLAVRERAAHGQVIVATHNANIPVLGDASQVIVLESDGRLGFVRLSAALDDDEAVDAITTLMEGGREAFERRAAFYKAHDHGE